MDGEELRLRVLSAFTPKGEYSHVLPFRRSGYVDGMFHLGMLAGAARLAGDDLLEGDACRWLRVLSSHGEARNWFAAPHEGYEPAGEHWVKPGTQSFAGPAAVQWARAQGCNVEAPEDVRGMARLFCALAWPFGWAIRAIPGLRQHLNSVMLAHLLLDRRPPASMAFLAARNPLYSWQFGTECVVEEYANTGPWPAKDWPGPITVTGSEQYTPVCSLVARYLRGIW
jgi:hypothetical protein